MMNRLEVIEQVESILINKETPAWVRMMAAEFLLNEMDMFDPHSLAHIETVDDLIHKT